MVKKISYEELEQRVQELEHIEAERNKTISLLKESRKNCKELLDVLRKEKKVSEEYINSLPGLFYVLDKNGMVAWNHEWNIIVGYTDDELRGMYGLLFFESEDRERAKKFAIKVFQDGVSSFEANLLTKEGRKIPYYFTGIRKKLFGKDHLIGLGVDISERKREEKEKQRLQWQLQQSYRTKAIGTLAGGIAHKFNNALCEITGNIELFKMANFNSRDIDKYTDRMLMSVSNMSNLSNQLLAYAEGGKYQPKTISLCDVVDSTLPIVIDKRLAAVIRVETDIPSNIFDITGDQAQIQMLISAIIENAVEAIETKGRIRVLLRNKNVDETFAKDNIYINPGSYVCLSVVDDGKGMDEETKRRIFEPFYTTNFYGRGLGMSAAYGIVKNHKGWINVDSESGKGTTISIYLPAAIDHSFQKNGVRNVQLHKRVGTVLIIEDEEMVMAVGKSMLEKMGHRVLTAANGKEALDVFENFKEVIDVVLLDIGLPDIGGEELYPAIMTLRPELKVVVMSGYSIEGLARDVLNAGADAYIQKPFIFSDLSQIIDGMIDRRQLKRIETTGNIFVIFKSLPSHALKVINIGKGGLAFCYENDNKLVTNSKEMGQFIIQLTGNEFSVDQIPCSVVADHPQSNTASEAYSGWRRCGVQFGELSVDQVSGLDNIIKSIC